MLCQSAGCSYKIHPNPKNNDGFHCCNACMKTPNKHGPACRQARRGLLDRIKAPKYHFPPQIGPVIVDERMQVVIAKYNENISWAETIANKIIYNKGPAMNSVISLPNVGREGHTFAYHIVKNYDNLFEYTCFLQGHPFDHCPNVLHLIQKPPPKHFNVLAKNISSFNLDSCPIHRGLPLRNCYKMLFNSNSNATYNFGHGAQMIVSRAAIHRHPKEFYQKIITMLSYSVNPIEGFVIERFWKLIFTA
jgi:hypothetical protein